MNLIFIMIVSLDTVLYIIPTDNVLWSNQKKFKLTNTNIFELEHGKILERKLCPTNNLFLDLFKWKITRVFILTMFRLKT